MRPQKSEQRCIVLGAAAKSGKGSMKVKQEILLRHIESSKSVMFQKAKKKMLEELRTTLVCICPIKVN